MITKTDLKTHLYPEVAEAISRGDDDIITRAISAGEAEAKSYLSRFDVATLFGGTLDYAITAHLRSVILDISAWHLVKLANPNIDLKLLRTAYEDAISWLKLVQAGKVSPSGFPLPVDDPLTTDVDEAEGNQFISASSNEKRTQHF